jgi:glycosyltransferase involved in cell wall biosynthesis
MKRIIIVTNSLTGGGAERSMNLIGNALTKIGYEIFIMPVNAGETDFVENQCQVIELGRVHKSGLFQLIFISYRFRKTVNQINPDLLVLNCDLPELLGCFSGMPRKILVIEHANPAWSTRSFFGHIVRYILRNRGAKFAAVSNHLRIWPTQNTPEFILPNIIVQNPQFMKPSTNTPDITRLVFIGRLASVQKRPEWLIEITKEVGLPLIFIGEGNAREPLERATRMKDINATFYGQIQDPWSALNSGDLLIVPSLFEGDGLVVLEALARRVPILLSDIPDFRRFGLGDHNYCFSPSEFVMRIQQFANNLDGLIVNEDQVNLLLSERSAANVSESWIKALCFGWGI